MVIRRTNLKIKTTGLDEALGKIERNVKFDVSMDEASYLKSGPKAAIQAAIQRLDGIYDYFSKDHPSLAQEVDKGRKALKKAITWLRYKEESKGSDMLNSAINALQGVADALHAAGYVSSAEMVEQAKMRVSKALGRLRGGVTGVKRAYEDIDGLDEVVLDEARGFDKIPVGASFEGTYQVPGKGKKVKIKGKIERVRHQGSQGRGIHVDLNPPVELAPGDVRDGLIISHNWDGRWTGLGVITKLNGKPFSLTSKDVAWNPVGKRWSGSEGIEESFSARIESKKNELSEDVATTILQQLGGNRFMAMTGAKKLFKVGDGLQFDVGRNAKKITRVVITLDPSDTYTMKFYRGRGIRIKLVKELNMIYADQLQDIFTKETGLYTSL